MKVLFKEVYRVSSKTVKCSGGCGRRLKRSKKFYQTLNPFNVLPSGAMKSRENILSELQISIQMWKSSPEICVHCAMMQSLASEEPVK